MLHKFKCPVCGGRNWLDIEKYSYNKRDAEGGTYSRIRSVWRKIKILSRILLIGSPTQSTISCSNLTPPKKLRLKVLFEVWFKNNENTVLVSKYCTECGFATISPRPEEWDITDKYSFLKHFEPDIGGQSTYSRYEKYLDYKRGLKILDLTKKFLPLKDIKVLDYGGGDGKLMQPYQVSGHTCYIIDYNDSPLPGITKLGNTVNDINIENFFDIVICSHVLEHVSDVTNLVNKLRMSLKSNGVIYAEVPQEIWAGIRIETDPVTHINFFTLNSFKKLFMLNGFEILDCKQEISNYGRSFKEVIWIIAKKCSHPEWKIKLDVDTPALLFPNRFYSLKKIFKIMLFYRLKARLSALKSAIRKTEFYIFTKR